MSAPRKLLALDGGGIRGILTLEVLDRMEALLREELDADSGFVLGDYFDYVAGTSTGAIIAAGIATGMSVDKLKKLYTDTASTAFAKLRWHKFLARFRYRYEATGLAALLKEQFGSGTPFGAKRKTLLLAVLHNSETDSPWPLSSNPNAKYNDPVRPDNNNLAKLWQIVRASAAAPTFFPPEVVHLQEDPPEYRKVFVDGALTPYNNPAFQLFLMATLPEYRLCWPTGADKLLLVSVGTGMTPREHRDLHPDKMNLVHTLKTVPGSLMFGAANQQDVLCRVFGECRFGERIDGELGDLVGSPGLGPKLFSYVRYNATFSQRELEKLDLSYDPVALSQLDAVDEEHIASLVAVGEKVAERVESGHFAGFLELASGDLSHECPEGEGGA